MNTPSSIAIAFGALVGLGGGASACSGSGAFLLGSSGSEETTGATGAGGGDSAATTTGAGGGGSGTTTATGSTTGSGGAGAGPACPGLGDRCTGCLAVACEQLYCTCGANTECTDLIVCVQSCTPFDTGCLQGCLSNNESGITDAALLDDCAATACPGTCPGVQTVTACEKCLFHGCPATMNTCLATDGCTKVIDCVQACGDDFCKWQCTNQVSMEAENAAVAVGECAASQCGGTCN